jgi:hypothetical protein
MNVTDVLDFDVRWSAKIVLNASSDGDGSSRMSVDLWVSLRTVEIGCKARLLDPRTPVSGVDTPPVDPRLRAVAVIERTDGRPLNPGTGDLAVAAAWAIVQRRAVIPGAGKYDVRERTAADGDGFTSEDLDLLGEQVLDIYLNDDARWRGVPAAAWDFKIGGFQVLRKWLSYRDRRVLGRDLSIDEARTFTTMARRLAMLALLAPTLDANYLASADPSPQ